MITLCGFGVSNYYNKLKLCMLEKGVPFTEKLAYPWERASFSHASPLGRIPFVETAKGGLSETQAILEYLEDEFRDKPLFPAAPFARAKCRELLQHLELNVEWVVRRLYREAFFGGAVSAETKSDVRAKLAAGLEALARLAGFSPHICGADFTAADCAAIFHLDYVRQASLKIYGEDFLAAHLPGASAYLADMAKRPHVQTTMADRAAALAAFQALKIDYAG
ncbi:glutathione S-transferase [Rhodoblastus sphagnicola]|uniref:Glutathione S-transferase n=1 Tax=Rhodoblastus sphagnicola TaxID=333368 RepID=A0A2S6N726_9HYPH|nr:glutathione S-transferase [Rhodoblastus sphagnicola]PPQ30410.1 glutathione S-transferase [Rhodoblastus sphagnicola]